MKAVHIRNLMTTLLAWLAIAPLAATEHVSPMMEGGTREHVERGTYEGIAWLSGGVGEDERKAIMTAASEYSLKLEFANTGGSYLGDVNVVISRPGGDAVLSILSSGPWLLADLPPGHYEVRAEAEGQSFSETVGVPREGIRTVVFNRWGTDLTSSPRR